jgi:hypothetical protein
MNVSHPLGRSRAWRYVRLAGALLSLPLALWACTSHTLEQPDPFPETQTSDFYSVTPIRDVDLLFVIDNSGSTANKQANFTQNFPAFINALQMIPGGLPNIRVGVVTSDYGAGGLSAQGNACMGFGDNAAFKITDLAGNNCGLQPNAYWITKDGAMDNLVGGRTLQQVFSCMATRGTMGCGLEHQLQAANMALNARVDRNPMNMGFLRPDAFLAVILLTDEEDSSGGDDSGPFFMGPAPAGFADNARNVPVGHLCNDVPPPAMAFDVPLANCRANPNPPAGTLIPVSQVIDGIKGLKPGHEEKIVVAAIAGWPLPGTEPMARYRLTSMQQTVNLAQVCTGGGGGTPGLRIKAFLDAFQYNTLQSICETNYTGALTKIGNLVGQAVGNPCISAPLVDIDLAKADLQADCVVEETIAGKPPVALPQCGTSAARPCWSLMRANNCAASGYQMFVDRGGVAPPVDSTESIKCRTCGKPGDLRCTR